jgi:hypothetical protein
VYVPAATKQQFRLNLEISTICNHVSCPLARIILIPLASVVLLDSSLSCTVSLYEMHTIKSQRALLLSAALQIVNAVALPEPTTVPAKTEPRAPSVTPAAIYFEGDRSFVYGKRNLLSDIASGVDSVAKSWGSVLGTDLPSYFTEGIPNWFQGPCNNASHEPLC